MRETGKVEKTQLTFCYLDNPSETPSKPILSDILYTRAQGTAMARGIEKNG